MEESELKKDASHLLAKFGMKMDMGVTEFGVVYLRLKFCQMCFLAKHNMKQY